MHKILLMIFVIFTLAGYSQVRVNSEEQSPIIIPLDISTYRPIVEVTIDGKGPYNFIFDTGSTTNVIDESLNEEYEFEVLGEDPLQTPGSDNKLISQRVNVPQVGLPGTNISKDVTMNVIALRALLPVDGILGGYFFEEYLVTLDYPGSKLILTIGELNKNEKDVSSFIQDARSINLNIDIDGNTVEAHLDTGNPHSISLPYALKDKLTFKEEPKKGYPMRTPVATFDSYEAQLIGSIVIGNIVYENPQIRLVDGIKFANLGYVMMSELRTTIDRKNSLIKFEKDSIHNTVNKSEEISDQKNEYTGWYGGHERKIYLENGEMYFQKTGGQKLKLVKLSENLYEMVFNVPVNNELPKIRFEKNENNKVIGFTFRFKDGREDFIQKDS